MGMDELIPFLVMMLYFKTARTRSGTGSIYLAVIRLLG